VQFAMVRGWWPVGGLVGRGRFKFVLRPTSRRPLFQEDRGRRKGEGEKKKGGSVTGR